jgi:hypothetical protein
MADYRARRAVWEEKTKDIRAAIDAIVEPYRKLASQDYFDKYPSEIQSAILKPPAVRSPYESQMAWKAKPFLENGGENFNPPIKGDLKARYDTEKKTNVRNALAFALVAADQKGYFNELANALDSRQAYQAEVYLFELGKYEGKLTELHNYLKSATPRVRARIAHILGDIADPSSRPHIEELTRDKNSEVAAEAIAALRKLTPA